VYEGTNATLVNKGDVIGGPPFHATAWTLYKFNLFDHGAFTRIDYTYQNGTRPSTAGFSATTRRCRNRARRKRCHMRAGVYLSGWELSVFGNKPDEGGSASGDLARHPSVAGPYYLTSYRPLTFGFTGGLPLLSRREPRTGLHPGCAARMTTEFFYPGGTRC